MSHGGRDIFYTVGDSYNQTIHLCKTEDNYDLLIVNKEQKTIATNFDDLQMVEDEISENCNFTDTEW